tara:strand:- start:101 stop:1711 length:1611 start_codon:yes stop_codon:yes gene_type:complete
MSYRNPQQVVDTQSGQHIRNMMQQITGATVGVLSEIQKKATANRKAILEQEKKGAEAIEKISSDVYTEARKTSGIDFVESIQTNLAQLNGVVTKTQNHNRTNAQNQIVRNADAMGDAVKEFGVSKSEQAQTWNEVESKGVGNYGGLSLTGNNEQSLLKQRILFGTPGFEGSVRGEIDINSETGPQIIAYISDKNGVMVGTTDINQNDVGVIIPNAVKTMNSIQKSWNNYSGIKNEKSAIYMDQTVEYDPKVDELGYKQKYIKTNKEEILKLIRNGIDGGEGSDAYVYSQSVRGAIALYNDKAIPVMTDDKGNLLTPEEQAKLIIDPTKSTWEKNELGKPVDPDLETVLSGVANLFRVEKGIGMTPTLLGRGKPPKPDTPPVKEISAANKLYNAQVKLADASIKDMNELMETPLKEIGNRPFTLDEAGAFMQVVNKHRKAKGGKIKSMDEIKADFLKENTLEEWDAKGITAELGYVRESSGNKYIEQLPVGSYEQKTETLVDLLYPNLKTTKRNEMLNFIRGNGGETTSKANQDFNK